VSEPLGPVVIGPREIYDAVVRLQGSVDRLADQQAAVRVELADHEQRLRAGERLRWPLPALSAVMALVALVVTLLPVLTGAPKR
jgi:hypothetical protein